MGQRRRSAGHLRRRGIPQGLESRYGRRSEGIPFCPLPGGLGGGAGRQNGGRSPVSCRDSFALQRHVRPGMGHGLLQTGRRTGPPLPRPLLRLAVLHGYGRRLWRRASGPVLPRSAPGRHGHGKSLCHRRLCLRTISQSRRSKSADHQRPGLGLCQRLSSWQRPRPGR